MESDEFTEWKNTPASTMWLHGIPGNGKTVLSAAITQHLIFENGDNPEISVLQFYFNFNDAAKQLTAQMIRSLISQLLPTDGQPASYTIIQESYSQYGEGRYQPSFEDLLTTLEKLLGHRSTVFIVIDALDESTDWSRLIDTSRTISSLAHR